MEQKVLMERIRNGEDSAFAELIHPLIEKGYRTSYSLLNSKELAEDVLQNAMIEAYRNIMSGKEISYFTTWFYKLVSHRSIDVLRKNGRLKESVIEMDAIKDELGLIDKVIREETGNEIKQGIHSLKNNDYRNVLILYYYEDFSIQEVSEILGLKTPTVKSHLRRARNALKASLLEKQIVGVNTQ